MKGTRVALGLLAVSLLAACGGGGSGDGGSGGGTSQPASTQITGTASKGILSNAIVTAYGISNGSKGSQLAQTRTGSNGQYTLTLTNHSGPVLVELTVDATTQMKCDAPAGCGTGIAFGQNVNPAGLTLQSVLPQASGTTQAAITPFTHLAAQLAQSRSGGLSATNIGNALTQVADLFDLPPLASTQPVDITATNLGSDVNAQRYAVLGAAIAQMAGTPAQLNTVLGGLSAELVANNGQLAGNSATETYDQAAVLAAAQVVATAPAVSAKLDSLVGVVIGESLTSAQSLGEAQTTASGTDSGSTTELDKVKGFVSQAHDLAQSILQAKNDTVAAEVTDKMSTIPLLQQNDELQRLGEALNVTHALMLHLAQDVVINGSTDTTLTSADATALLSTLGYDDNLRIGISFGDNFSVALDPANRRTTANGTITVSLYDRSSCPLEVCTTYVPEVGTRVTFTASNLQFSYPSLSTPAAQFTFGVATNGSLESTGLKLDFTAGSGSGLTASYGTSHSLAEHMAALDDVDPNNDKAHFPSRLQLTLNQASLTIKNAPSSHFSKFTGTINFALDSVDLPLVNGLSGSSAQLIPSLLSVAGSFSSAAGEKLEASMSLDLDDNLALQALASPNAGYVRQSLYQLSYNSGTDTATFAPGSGYSFYSNGWGQSADAVQVRLVPTTQDSYCGTGHTQLEITGLQGDTPSYGPWTGYTCYSPTDTLATVLPTELDPNNYSSSLIWNLMIAPLHEGIYVPTLGSSLATGPLNGQLRWSDENGITQDPTHFARGAFSATLKLKLGGSANLDTEVSVSGHRSSFTGGDIAIKLANNGKWLQLAIAGTDLTLGRDVSLSNQDGVSVIVRPQNLDDDNSGNDAFELRLNGTAYGKLYQLAGAWVARFSDNSFTLL